jgi:predicted ATPase
LTVAAVIGERFNFQLLSELTHTSESDLLQQLHELIAASLIVETSAGEFSFRHALIRDAIAASLLAQERQDLHLKVANTLEKLYPDRQENYVSDLAYHYYEAGAWEKAMEYGQIAGQNAMNLAAM